VNVMNPTEEPQVITIPKLTDLFHEVFDIVLINNMHTYQKYINTGNRIQLLKDMLRCDHMNQ